MSKIDSHFKDLPEGFITLVLSDADKLLETNLSILKELTSKKHFGLYVTVNQPYKQIVKTLDKNSIDMSNMFFIDCISRMAGEKSRKGENVVYITSPSGLTELGIAISQALDSFPQKEKKYLYMDALSTLIVYNTAGTIAKFSHFIMNKIRLMGLSGVFIAVNKEIDETLIAQISELCDNIVKTD